MGKADKRISVKKQDNRNNITILKLLIKIKEVKNNKIQIFDLIRYLIYFTGEDDKQIPLNKIRKSINNIMTLKFTSQDNLKYFMIYILFNLNNHKKL